jgi:outer membrane protein assembly factor BamB
MNGLLRWPVWAGVWAALAGGAALSRAGDWPQILGPERNGRAADEPDLVAWAAGGPRVQWSGELGEGYAGPAVVGSRVIVFHRVADRERLEALDATSGKSLWRADFPATYAGGINPDRGPRCVPLIHEQRVYAYGAAGDLHCVRLSDGQPLWSRQTLAEFSGREGYFGAGSTPIVADGKILVNVGGKQSGLVAFQLLDGATAWQATDEGASYSSPTASRVAGEPCVIFVTRLNAVGVAPRDGTIRFRFAFGERGPTVNAATPLVFDDYLFVSASYGIGAQLLRLEATGPAPIWANDATMSSQYSTCVYDRGFLYGTHGREDAGEVELRCLEALTGNVRWRVPDFRPAHVTLVGSQLLVLTSEGRLFLAPASPEGFRPLAQATVSQRVTRALPALSRGKLFFRDNDEAARNGRLICLDLAPPPPP